MSVAADVELRSLTALPPSPPLSSASSSVKPVAAAAATAVACIVESELSDMLSLSSTVLAVAESENTLLCSLAASLLSSSACPDAVAIDDDELSDVETVYSVQVCNMSFVTCVSLLSLCFCVCPHCVRFYVSLFLF